jgi:hypothetical protein
VDATEENPEASGILYQLALKDIEKQHEMKPTLKHYWENIHQYSKFTQHGTYLNDFMERELEGMYCEVLTTISHKKYLADSTFRYLSLTYVARPLMIHLFWYLRSSYSVRLSRLYIHFLLRNDVKGLIQLIK